MRSTDGLLVQTVHLPDISHALACFIPNMFHINIKYGVGGLTDSGTAEV